MKWKKAPEELKDTLAKAMEGIECQKRLMFGYPAYFINGNIFAGLFQSSVFLRLSPDRVASLRKVHPSISALEPMPGRPMKDYFVLNEAIYQDEGTLRKIARDAAQYTTGLAPKVKATKKRNRN